MVPRHGKRRRQIVDSHRLLHTGSSVIHPACMLGVTLARLCCGAVFANVVQQSGASGMLPRIEGSGKFCRSLRHPLDMIPQRLIAAILPLMRYIVHPSHLLFSLGQPARAPVRAQQDTPPPGLERILRPPAQQNTSRSRRSPVRHAVLPGDRARP